MLPIKLELEQAYDLEFNKIISKIMLPIFFGRGATIKRCKAIAEHKAVNSVLSMDISYRLSRLKFI